MKRKKFIEVGGKTGAWIVEAKEPGHECKMCGEQIENGEVIINWLFSEELTEKKGKDFCNGIWNVWLCLECVRDCFYMKADELDLIINKGIDFHKIVEELE